MFWLFLSIWWFYWPGSGLGRGPYWSIFFLVRIRIQSIRIHIPAILMQRYPEVPKGCFSRRNGVFFIFAPLPCLSNFQPIRLLKQNQLLFFFRLWSNFTRSDWTGTKMMRKSNHVATWNPATKMFSSNAWSNGCLF